MMKTFSKFSKFLGLFLILIGIPILLTSKSHNPELPLLSGLFVLFISNQTREDERSGAIRSSAALFALIIGYTIKLVISNLYQHQMIGFDLISINYFLILVFSLANIIRFSRLYIFMA
ncbi:hypothetical protein [Pedobacter frigoris]|uniref:hypothetical protein n=1 Tax=Pedobacter frigoris TaxID=2571272 RepID=UPI00293127DA|nr:hypothetical protein [Pedobacter frigoris]